MVVSITRGVILLEKQILIKEDSETGIKNLFCYDNTHLRVFIRNKDDKPFVKDWYFSTGHPQELAKQALDSLIEHTGSVSKLEKEQLESYVKTDEFWKRIQTSAVNSSNEKDGSTCSVFLAPFQTKRTKTLKYLSIQASPSRDRVTIKTTAPVRWSNIPALKRFKMASHAYGYGELFRLVALYTAFSLLLLEQDSMPNSTIHQQQYVLGIYFTLVSKWRRDIERAGLKSFFFDEEAARFNLTIYKFINRVDAELKVLSNRSLFNTDTKHVKSLAQNAMRSESYSYEERYVIYRQHRRLLLEPLAALYPEGFTTSELSTYLTEKMQLGESYSRKIIRWNNFAPAMTMRNGNHLWRVKSYTVTGETDDDFKSRFISEVERWVSGREHNTITHSELKRELGDTTIGVSTFNRILNQSKRIKTRFKLARNQVIFSFDDQKDKPLAIPKEMLSKRELLWHELKTKLIDRTTFHLDEAEKLATGFSREELRNALRERALFFFIGKNRKDAHYALRSRPATLIIENEV